MNDKEILEFEDRAYVSPTISRDEQMDFIDNYRNVLQNNVQRINTQTHNLGTDVPSNLGGLTGADATFENRYVTPQANQAVAELRAKAQGEALTQALNNLKSQMNKRYKDAYRKARISEYNKNNNGGGGKDKLESDTNPDDDTKEKISKDQNKGQKGKMYSISDGVAGYTDSNGKGWKLGSIKEFDKVIIGSRPLPTPNEGTFTQNGVTYMYIDNDQVDRPTWYRVTPLDGE